jgi:hypothetical protein
MAAPTENTAAEGMPPTNAPMIVPPFAAFPRTQSESSIVNEAGESSDVT